MYALKKQRQIVLMIMALPITDCFVLHGCTKGRGKKSGGFNLTFMLLLQGSITPCWLVLSPHSGNDPSWNIRCAVLFFWGGSLYFLLMSNTFLFPGTTVSSRSPTTHNTQHVKLIGGFKLTLGEVAHVCMTVYFILWWTGELSRGWNQGELFIYFIALMFVGVGQNIYQYSP